MNVLLTSSGLETEVIEKEFKKMLQKAPSEIRAMFIPVAANSPDAIDVLPKCLNDLVKCEIKRENIFVYDLHDTIQDNLIEKYDVIYLCGGSPQYLLRRIKEIGNIRMVYVSLDGDNASLHDSFRNMNGAFQRTVNAIHILQEYNIKVTINLIINHENYQRIGKITEFFKNDLGVPCRVAPILDVGRGKYMGNKLSLHEISIAISEWCQASGIDDKRLVKKFIESGGNKVNTISNIADCGVGNRMVFIKSNGEVCLCPTLTSSESKEFVFGSVRDDEIENIWYKSVKRKRFEDIHCNDKDCKLSSICKGGCRSRAFFMSNDVMAQDPLPCYHLNRLLGE